MWLSELTSSFKRGREREYAEIINDLTFHRRRRRARVQKMTMMLEREIRGFCALIIKGEF